MKCTNKMCSACCTGGCPGHKKRKRGVKVDVSFWCFFVGFEVNKFVKYINKAEMNAQIVSGDDMWKPFLKYEVSHSGNIRRKSDRFPIKRRLHPAGYLTCTLRRKGKPKSYLVHRLVALAFLQQHGLGYTVDHINRQRDDPRLANLRWATGVEQQANTSKRKRKAFLRVRAEKNGVHSDFANIHDAARHLPGKSTHVTSTSAISRAISSKKLYRGYKW